MKCFTRPLQEIGVNDNTDDVTNIISSHRSYPYNKNERNRL